MKFRVIPYTLVANNVSIETAYQIMYACNRDLHNSVGEIGKN